MSESAVYAAGGVVWRIADGKLRILVVHRTRYVDVTLPKGKVDPGETLAATAVREIYEECGIRAALGIPVGVSRYNLPSGKLKIVHYWAAHATDDAIRESAFVPNKEIAAIEWISPKKALARLSYPVDVEILAEFLRFVDDGVLETFPVIVLRHAKAMPRRQWDGTDAERPLTSQGKAQAKALVTALTAFGPEQIVSSDAVRCLSTVKPLSKATGMSVKKAADISQDAWESAPANVRGVIGRRVRARRPVVVCSHRPVLPRILDELAIATGTIKGSYLTDAATLAPAGFSVVHVSATNPGSGIIAIESHEPKL